MNPLNNLPQRGDTHDTADAAETALREAIGSRNLFVLQQADKSDYGTDVQIEARSDSSMTNARAHIQLKGTNQAANADGSVSISVARSNLNYLLAQPNSTYVCYHKPSKRLLAHRADDVYCEYEHRGSEWQTQETITIRFSQPFDSLFQDRLHARMISESRSSRDWRLAWIREPPEHATQMAAILPPPVEVPFAPAAALRQLQALYDAGQNITISCSFEGFSAVLRDLPGGMDFAYMAEINLGLYGCPFSKERIRHSIAVLEDAGSRLHRGSLLYCQGNAYLVLGEHESARDAYSCALALLGNADMIELAAQCLKNLGAALAGLGDTEGALSCYQQALDKDPDLAEARFAVAMWHCRFGDDPAKAIEHLDQVTPRKGSGLQMSSVQGWRINLLFRIGDTDGAFREINVLLGHAAHESWIWPWCAKQVAEFGRRSSQAAKKSVGFWKAYMREHLEQSAAEREHLLCHWLLRSNDVTTDMTFDTFKSTAERLAQGEAADAAFLWDRVGHWAEFEDNWQEAEKAYRKAYDIRPDEFGYCLGTALNFLSRYVEALPILVEQAERHQPDAMSWYQVAVAHGGLGDDVRCIAAYQMALELDEEYELAWFNLGGAYWNSGQTERAITTWKEAVRRYPNHALVATVMKFVPVIFEE